MVLPASTLPPKLTRQSKDLTNQCCRFGEDVLETMLAWTDQLLGSRSAKAHKLPILDLGTGNGLFAMKLATLGYQNLTGCDYSAASIKLAQAIAEKAGQTGIKWVQDDLLDSGIDDRYFNLLCKSADKTCSDCGLEILSRAVETQIV